jgi:hypothetical protein
LFQREGYAVCHNLGAGMLVLTREAARLVLDNFRSGFTTDNRKIFCQLAGIDIGTFWAFGFGEHNLVADWHFDAMLAAHGLASLALTPSPCAMIGQVPPLAEQGLTIATGPVEVRRDDKGFTIYSANLAVRDGDMQVGVETQFQLDAQGVWKYLPHQMHLLRGGYTGDWRLRELRGAGEFGWVSSGSIVASFTVYSTLEVPLFGFCAFLISGGKTGGKARIKDLASGYDVIVDLEPEGNAGKVMQVLAPAGIAYRQVRMTMLTPGCCFYGIQTREKQPVTNARFEHSILPPV